MMENELRRSARIAAVTSAALPIKLAETEKSCHPNIEEKGSVVVPTTTAAESTTSTSRSVPAKISSQHHSTCSSRSKISKTSVMSQRRLLEARAARLSAEIEVKQQAVNASVANAEHKRLTAEKALIRAKLEEQLAALDGSQISESSRSLCSDRTKDWVEETSKQHEKKEVENVAIEQLTRAITDAIKVTSNPATNKSNDKLLGRFSAKDLPAFSGDPLEWLRFKNAFETTTRVGQFSEEENVSRLQHCLRGDAWEAVAARLIATKSATEIIKTLEMRFGRPDLVLTRLIQDMKRVPKLSGAPSEVIILATKVDNCTAAIEAAGHNGYLYSPELINEIVCKMTEPIFYRWLDYTRALSPHDPILPVMAKFLMSMAEDICKRGAQETPQTKAKTSLFKRPVLLTNTDEESREDTTTSINLVSEKRVDKRCVLCNDISHAINNCSKFKVLDVNKRWEWICERKLCFRCLKSTHRRDRCKSKNKCTICKGYHHPLLHRDDWKKIPEKTEGESEPPEITANIWSTGKMNVFLKVLPVELQGPAGCVKTHALLDEGSTITLIESRIAEQIGASGPEEKLNIHGVVGQGNSVPSQMINLKIKTIEGDYEQLQRVRTVETMSLPYHAIPREQICQYEHLMEVLPDDIEGQPTMLIGQDNWSLIITREVRERKKNEPVASLTRLGWVIHGFSSSVTKNMTEFSFCTHHDEEIDEMIKNYFYYDGLGVKNVDHPRYTPDEQRALHILDSKSRMNEKRWETGLLWRSDDVNLPNNRRNAECRLRIIERMMDADPNFAADYTKQVNNMLEKNYAEEAKEEPTGRIWYLPHFGVRNPNKPEKLRLVFDAKAETKSISLNTELLTGPDLLNSLLGVLFRFREKAIAVTADIREMFLRVKIIKEDQNAQCFLWRGSERKEPPRTYKMTSMTFGATSSPCTATYIIRRNADRYAASHPRAVEAIKRRHYVDDYLDSLDDEEEMKQLVFDVTMIHADGGFDIRSWASNKPSVLAKTLTDNEPVSLLQENEVQRTLGLNWQPSVDTLGYDLSLKKIDKDVIDGVRPPTKREMLKVTMSVFDPLGMLCPLLIRSKIMLQEIWCSNIKWDQQVDYNTTQAWRKWLQDLIKCRSFCVPRCYGIMIMRDSQLHVFVDASEQAFAAVAYLRQDEKVVFIAGKSRVAPLKSGSTIPRLELQAALMGARLGRTIRKEHSIPIDESFYWTDSRTVWCWIQNNPRRVQVFVTNRLAEIDEMTKPNEWRWIPGSLNPADAATRSTKHAEKLWVSGPDFLRQPEDKWPIFRTLNEEEMKPPSEAEVLAIVETEKIIDDTRFSNWRKLVRSMARALYFIERCRRKTNTHLSPDNESQAKILILLQAQLECFGTDIALIKGGHQLKPQSKLLQLNPVLDDEGLLRANSRLEAGRDLPTSLKRPIILDAKHNVTKLIMESRHRQLGHYGTATLLNELRQEYHIFRLRTEIRSMIAKCVLCKIRRSRCEQPMMAGLPAMRLEHNCRPFTFCGVDLFGPISVTVGRRREKRWAALFTCLSIRAVHIELVSSLNTDSTIMAIRRMAARRGYPKQIHSDNGTNFRSADKELRAALENDQIVDKAAEIGIKWTFNPPSAPHMGGVWERLVRSVKTALGAILNTQTPKEELLNTLLAEAENIVNSRPLTDVSLDPNDGEALTPNHFLLGSSNGLPAPGIFLEEDTNLRKQWRVAQRMTDKFWTRWVCEYLPILRTRTKWMTNSRNLAVGDFVLIADGALPRNTWPRGRISAVIQGRDGCVRIVDVATAGGTLRRPASKIVRIYSEAASGSEEENM